LFIPLFSHKTDPIDPIDLHRTHHGGNQADLSALQGRKPGMLFFSFTPRSTLPGNGAVLLARQGHVANKDADCQAALVTYVTAGFPTVAETPQVLLSMEKGGAGECD
jgi:hypothetical protein